VKGDGKDDDWVEGFSRRQRTMEGCGVDYYYHYYYYYSSRGRRRQRVGLVKSSKDYNSFGRRKDWKS